MSSIKDDLKNKPQNVDGKNVKVGDPAVGAAEIVLDVAEQKKNDLLDMARHFFKMEAAGGIMLVIAAITALIIANTPLNEFYHYVFNDIKFRIGFSDIQNVFDYELKKSLLHWINDGLMAIFFLLVGLEIKREIVDGELSSRSRALLPAIAAVGGIVMPALIYYWINQDSPQNLDGWAIPAATDIAFALGVLSLLGSRVPVRIKVLLTAIAIIDDIAAILIIALFYTTNIEVTALYVVAGIIFLMFVLNQRGVSSIAPYVILGVILWVAVFKTGVHATLAGVVTAFFIPMRSSHDPDHSPVKMTEHALHYWVAFGVLPLFAFANAGVPFKGMGLDSFLDPVTLGIALGLIFGKPLGIFTLLFLTIKSGISPMPSGTTWRQLFAVSVLCGIGFTMSLFIGGLAFDSVEMQAAVRLGVLGGSVVAALAGFVILFSGPKPQVKTLDEVVH